MSKSKSRRRRAHNHKRMKAHREAAARTLLQLSANDTQEVKKELDIDDIPVTISICNDGQTGLQAIDSIPIIYSSLEHASTVEKVLGLLGMNIEIVATLKNDYGLTLGDHKDSILCFTDGHGARHELSLAGYATPDQASPRTAAILAAWKVNITRHNLDLAPACTCCDTTHGVEIKEVLWLDATLKKCREFRAECERMGEVAKQGQADARELYEKRHELVVARRTLRRLQRRNDEVELELAEYDVAVLHSGETDGEDDDALEDVDYDRDRDQDFGDE